MKKIILIITTIVLISVSTYSQTEELKYYNSNSTQSQTINITEVSGNKLAVMVYFPPEMFTHLIGGSLEEIYIGIGRFHNLTNLTVAIWTDLTNINTPEYTQEYTSFIDATEGLNMFQLETPYILGNEGIYVGYYFDVIDNYTKPVITLLGSENPDGNDDIIVEMGNGAVAHINAFMAEKGNLPISAIVSTSVSTYSLSNNELLKIYPNPTSEYIIVENKKHEDIQILDITGKTILNVVSNKKQQTVNVSKLQNGIYFVKSGNTIQKFIKE